MLSRHGNLSERLSRPMARYEAALTDVLSLGLVNLPLRPYCILSF